MKLWWKANEIQQRKSMDFVKFPGFLENFEILVDPGQKSTYLGAQEELDGQTVIAT